MFRQKNSVRVAEICRNLGAFKDLHKLCKDGGLNEALQVVDLMFQQGIPISRDIIYNLLQACMAKKDSAAGKRVYSFMVICGLDSIATLGNHLIRLFTSCGSLPEASQVFEKVSKPTVFTYNAIMAAHANLGDGNKALALYVRMRQDRIKPDKVTFLCILKSCGGKEGAIRQGRLIHNVICQNGLESDVNMANTIIDTYGKCGSLPEAHAVFHKLPNRDVVSWAALIAGYIQNEEVFPALELFEKIQQEGLKPNIVIYLCVLKACSAHAALSLGRQIHEDVTRAGIESELSVGSTLVDMYAKCRNLEEAQNVFDKLPSRNIVTWNVMIAGYAQYGHGLPALALFERMQEEGIKPNNITYLGVLKACGSIQALEDGSLIHEQIIRSGLENDLGIGNSFVDMYAKSGSLEAALKMFENLQNRDVVSWGAVIAGCTQHGQGLHSLELFEDMQQEGINPNEIIFVCVLKACGSIGAIEQGRRIHDLISRSAVEVNVVLGSTIVDMYAKCGSLEDAHNMFHKLLNRDKVSWGAIISGYAQHGHGHIALELFQTMQEEGIQPNEVIFLCILQACNSLGALEQGRTIHHQIIRSGFQVDLAIGNTLVDMYAKGGCLEEARRVFEDMLNRDLVTWGAMMTGYTQHGFCLAVFELFEKMQQDNVIPNRVIFLCVLKACGSIGAIGQGREIHKEIIETGLESDGTVGNALLDMYTKCGGHVEALSVFDKLENKDVVSWSAIVAGHACSGNCRLALQCFEVMLQHGLKPDGAIFSSILAACSHAGLLEKGNHYFNSMRENYGIMPTIQHYNSMVDLLGRVGKLKEAEDLLQSLPISADTIGWTSLLAGCRTYGDTRLGERCFEVVQLDPNDASGYMLMSNIYADAHMWKDAKRIDELRKHTPAVKRLGMAWIGLNDKVHEFIVGRKSSFEIAEIDVKVKVLGKAMKDEGFVPQVEVDLP